MKEDSSQIVRIPIPKRPKNYENKEFPNFVTSKDEFKFVEKLIPNEIVPDPPVHQNYPTPSGWIPVNVDKALSSSYRVLRTRFHNYPIYRNEREGGSRKLVRIKNIDGDIWVFPLNIFSR